MIYRLCGYDPPKQKPVPRCPVCGGEAEILYINDLGEVFGCDNCVLRVDAYDYTEEVCESAQSDFDFNGRYEPAGMACSAS